MAECEGTTNGGTTSVIVAKHYNSIEEKGLKHRNLSKILYLRNFNNWIKSMLISEYLEKIADNKKIYRAPIRVLDLGCGKGGDWIKWKKNPSVKHVICVDIAENSIEDCKKRYDTVLVGGGSRNEASAEFIVADFTKSRLRGMYKDPTVELDLVSCQFAFHYCFESLEQAECMMKNVSECLRKGGFFIGTIPDAYEIVHRLKESESNSFGNDVYKITFDDDIASCLPLFGAKYNFQLEDVVDCPEFLVYFPVLEKLAAKFGLKCVLRKRFSEFFNENIVIKGKFLLQRMSALETFPAPESSTLSSSVDGDYKKAEEYLEKHKDNKYIGTMSKTEWEATSLYSVFAFEKVGIK